MGMYTEIFFRAEIDEESYKLLRALETFGWDTETVKKPEHPFFNTDRAELVLFGDSAYFPGHETFRLSHTHSNGLLPHTYDVSFRSSLKNYEQEIQSFFDWIAPHVRTYGPDDTFVGYSLYEEAVRPTLWFVKDFVAYPYNA